MNDKNYVFIFDVDGTITNSTIYTPLIVELRNTGKHILLVFLYFISPIIIFIDFLSRSLHQYLFYKVFSRYFCKYSSNIKLMETYEKKEIQQMTKILKKVLHQGYDLYFVSTNNTVLNRYLTKFMPKGIYTVEPSKASIDYLKSFKINSVKHIKALNPNKHIISFSDSPSDISSLDLGHKGYLFKRNRIIKVK